MTDKAALFRRLHAREGAFIIPNPWDSGTARILAALGFPALATTSAGMAFALGLADGQVGHDDMLRHCRAIVDATPLPVSADLGKGFGDSPESASETIRAAAAIGLAGGSLEDHSGSPEDPIFDFDLAVERIAAAAETCRALPTDFVLTARCENFLWGRPDLDDTIKRLRAFAAAGADVLFAPGLRDLTMIRTLCHAVSKPVNVVMGSPGLAFGARELAEAGVKRISTGSSLARTAFAAFIDAAQELRTDGSFHFAEKAISYDALAALFIEGSARA